MKHFLHCHPILCAITILYIFDVAIAGTSTASLQEEIKQKACDTEGEHIETV